ncbi:LysR substrate-binding domain-containing protein [Mesorhizobium humile]|uniref:LysR substrate-binding domain-containing protein n=1 Tax=Mesorhizobium humile TaxID=3072313 RepID=A0ABU4YH30_9HYPH|nr:MULTISPECIES: LysR substrate-binding domain-containing protein [unclassified Mesorhizobium]MDX8457588.1 LysR substrate-binding domain-containing protein [Mesorhizobium sp. VK2D]MDX8485603.1 LysR substrate-binding domain-containing protein [Mesorhizobium sp. VK2B]
MQPPVSLLALRAFAEVGRHGSVKRAAAALGVTPGAISQQVKLLEHRLGVTLLERRNREVRVTADGMRLLEPLSAGFQQIEDAVGLFAVASPSRKILTVSTTPSFAASWLVPRLGRFSARYPDLYVRVDTTPRLVDLRSEGVDVALRHGAGSYSGLEAVRLFTPQLICVGSPALLAGGPPMLEPNDCLHHPLLQDRDRADWPLWLRARGVGAIDERARNGPCFENDLLLIRAAIAGQGLALVRDVYASDELSSGRIVLALEGSSPTADAYYFVARPEAMATTKVAAFRDWIFEESANRV